MGWLAGWNYRKSHIVNAAAGAGTLYQKMITVHYGAGADNDDDVYCTVGGVAHCKTDFGDIRFTDNDGTTLLDYWLESKIDSNYAIFWVEVADSLETDPQTIYVYYGNAGVSTTSNGANTWIYFDNFEGITPLNNYTADIGNINDWEIAVFGDGKSLHYKGATAWYLLSRNGSSITNLRILCQIYPDTISNYYNGISWRETASNNWYWSWLAYDSSGYAGSGTLSRNDWDKRIAGSDTYISGASTVSLHKTWVKLEVTMAGNACKTYVNDTIKANSTDAAISSAGKVGFMGLYAGYFDNWCVGKFVSPEPTHGVWGGEELSIIENFLTHTLNVSHSTLMYKDKTTSGTINFSASSAKGLAKYLSEALDLLSSILGFKNKTTTGIINLSGTITKGLRIIIIFSRFEVLSKTDIDFHSITLNIDGSDEVGTLDAVKRETLLGITGLEGWVVAFDGLLKSGNITIKMPLYIQIEQHYSDSSKIIRFYFREWLDIDSTDRTRIIDNDGTLTLQVLYDWRAGNTWGK